MSGEGSGSYGYAFAVYAAAEGATVLDVPGILTQRNRKHSTSRGKSDRNDARAIAEVVIREPEGLARFTRSVIERALRMRYDQRDRLVRERTRAANRLRSAALLIGIAELPADITPNRTVRRLAASATDFRLSISANVALDAILDEFDEACESIIRINEQVKAIQRQIAPLVQRVAPDLLKVHGISEVAAAGIIGHAGDISNCRTAAAFASKCGVSPVDCSSGRKLGGQIESGW